jgi:2-acylglycerol O-acyltransferase 2
VLQAQETVCADLAGYHPHGIISLGAFGVFGTEACGFSTLFPGIHNSLLTLSSNFRIPFYRDYIMSLGLASVSKRSCEKLLAHGPGHAITIVIGGAQESLLSRPHENDIVLKKRLGVFKIAMKHGASLVPVYAFGENDAYRQVENTPGTWLYSFQQFFKKAAGFTVPMFHARGVLNYDFGLLPYRTPINVVVGKPIRVQKHTNPTLEEIQAVQAQYIEELMDIWERYKDQFAPDRTKELTLIE